MKIFILILFIIIILFKSTKIQFIFNIIKTMNIAFNFTFTLAHKFRNHQSIWFEE